MKWKWNENDLNRIIECTESSQLSDARTYRKMKRKSKKKNIREKATHKSQVKSHLHSEQNCKWNEIKCFVKQKANQWQSTESIAAHTKDMKNSNEKQQNHSSFERSACAVDIVVSTFVRFGDMHSLEIVTLISMRNFSLPSAKFSKFHFTFDR